MLHRDYGRDRLRRDPFDCALCLSQSGAIRRVFDVSRRPASSAGVPAGIRSLHSPAHVSIPCCRGPDSHLHEHNTKLLRSAE